MKKSGGIISIIAGLLGIFASLFTIFSGGLVGALESSGETGGEMIIGMGFWGIALSFLVIVFAALAMNTNSKIHGVILIVVSLFGVILGGSFVAVCMFLSLIGGILVCIGAGKKEQN
tara:strand:+ start:763 stop:1113 length:351 start_codon:yes stop_codon:yes gene_type:complete